MHFTLRSLRATVVAGLFAIATTALADDTPKADKPAADAKTEAADRSLREQDIYIPYEKLRQVFEKHGRGVFLPYEKFDELWRAAQDKTRPAAEPQPPVGAIITDIDNEATVAKDVVQVKARLKIDLLTEGWHEVPLRLSDAALVHATLKGEPARILGGAGEDHRLLVEKKGKQPEQIELELEYARAITRTPGQNSVSFQAPQAPVSRWRVRIPQAGVKVNLFPLIAATEVPAAVEEKMPGKKDGTGGASGTQTEKPATKTPAKTADETVILAFVGASPTVRIDWTPKAEGATGLAALASVQAEQQVWVQEGITRIRTNLAYAISRAELSQLAIEVPADYKVVNVFDANVRQWAVEPPAGQVQRITAQLFEPAKTNQQVTVELEKIVEKRADALKVPVVKALNVVRQQGFVVVQVGAGLRAEAARTSGLSQVDAAELPPALRAANWAFAYRYATVSFELELSLEELQPRITVDSLVEARLEPERLTIDLTAVYTIERAGVFKLELDVPEGFDVRQVQGRALTAGDAAQHAAAADVDSHHVEGEKKNRLVVNLARKALGRVALGVQLQKELNEPNLLTPSPTSTEIVLPVPQVRKNNTVERASGRLVIHAPESLRINPTTVDGLRTVSFKEAMEGMPWALAPQRPQSSPAPEKSARAELRPVLAFTFTQDPIDLRLAAERRKPQVTIRQLLVARIEEGVIKYQATFYYTILYSGVKSLRIDVPADVAPVLRNITSGIREKTLDPQPPELAKEKLVAWTLTGDSELLGEGHVDLVWEKKIEKLEVGKGVDIDVPQLIPRKVDRSWGQIVLGKAETLDVREKDAIENLRPIDPQHDLMTAVSGGARAFEFHGDWKLPITVTRYELEEVKRTSIDRAVARMVVTQAGEHSAGEVSVQALYRIRSARPRLAVRLPADAALDSDPLRINGQSVALQQGQDKQYFVPLAASSADESFLLELRYTVHAGRRLELPLLGEGVSEEESPAVQKMYLCVFVPNTQTLLGTRGPWSEEFEWCYAPEGKWVANNKLDDASLLNWVREGTKETGGAAATFHTDGTPYLFSTVRPQADSSLQLRTMSGTLLNGLIFGSIALVAIGLLWVGAAFRVLALGALIVVLVLLGVFSPTFSLHVLDAKFLLALFVALVLWTVVFVLRIRRPALACCQDLMERMKRKPAPVSTPTPAPTTPAAPSEGGPSHE